MPQSHYAARDDATPLRRIVTDAARDVRPEHGPAPEAGVSSVGCLQRSLIRARGRTQP